MKKLRFPLLLTCSMLFTALITHADPTATTKPGSDPNSYQSKLARTPYNSILLSGIKAGTKLKLHSASAQKEVPIGNKPGEAPKVVTVSGDGFYSNTLSYEKGDAVKAAIEACSPSTSFKFNVPKVGPLGGPITGATPLDRIREAKYEKIKEKILSVHEKKMTEGKKSDAVQTQFYSWVGDALKASGSDSPAATDFAETLLRDTDSDYRECLKGKLKSVYATFESKRPICIYELGSGNAMTFNTRETRTIEFESYKILTPPRTEISVKQPNLIKSVSCNQEFKTLADFRVIAKLEESELQIDEKSLRSASVATPTPPGRDPRLENAPFGNMYFNEFKFKDEAGKALVQKMNFLETNSKSVSIGTPTTKDQNATIVVAKEVSADQITSRDIESVVSACHGPGRNSMLEPSFTRLVNSDKTDAALKKRYQATLDQIHKDQIAEKKGVTELVTKALAYLKTTRHGDWIKESDDTRRKRYEDKRPPLKWYSSTAVIGTKEDRTLSEAFGAFVNDYMPHWYPSNDFSSVNHMNPPQEDYNNPQPRPPRPFSFKIDIDCLKKSWHDVYSRASKETLRCEVEFKQGVKPGSSFDTKSLKTLEFSAVTSHPGSSTEFSANHPKIKALWCPASMKTIEDLSSFFDLSTSDMRIKDRWMPAYPTPTPTPPLCGEEICQLPVALRPKNCRCDTPVQAAAPVKPTKKPAKKSTTATAPALNSALKKDDLEETKKKSEKEKKTEVKPGS